MSTLLIYTIHGVSVKDCPTSCSSWLVKFSVPSKEAAACAIFVSPTSLFSNSSLRSLASVTIESHKLPIDE